MSAIIQIEDLEKTYKVLNRHSGLKGAFRDLFSKDYKYIKAVDKISMDIKPGEIVGYLGPNGAGKSTTIKMMTGILEPTSGKIIVNGKEPHKCRTQNAQEIGLVFGQRSQLWWNLPLIESFKILKEIYRIDSDIFKENLELFEHLVNVGELYLKPVRQMSLGQRTLCDILAAFLHNPKIIFLDEPTIGLDVSMKNKIRILIQELNTRKNTTVILTTHDMGDVEALCGRIVIIDKGKKIFDDSFERLKDLFGKYRTLKVKVDLDGNDHQFFVQSIKNKYSHDKNLIFGQEEEDWFSLVIDESDIPLTEVLSFVMSNFIIKDVKIEEIACEEVVRKIYEGGMI